MHLNRVKHVERARKLLAMSEDAGSPAEAAIAERRLKVLMEKYDMSIAEIKRTEQEHVRYADHPNKPSTPVRRKRTRSSVRWKQPASSFKSNRLVAIAALCGFVATLGLWLFFNGNDSVGGHLIQIVEDQPSDNTQLYGEPALTAVVDRATVLDGGSFVLYIEGTGLSSIPDTSSLWRDFTVISTDISKKQNAHDYRIQVMLQPRRSGTLLVPSFSVNEVRSELIVIDVLPAN